MFTRIGAAALKKDLHNTIEMCARLNNPQHQFKTIHIAGTNGKGSTTQIITQLLIAHGLQVGTYTSPHLEALTERITRDGEQIDQQEFADCVAAVAAGCRDGRRDLARHHPPAWPGRARHPVGRPWRSVGQHPGHQQG